MLFIYCTYLLGNVSILHFTHQKSYPSESKLTTLLFCFIKTVNDSEMCINGTLKNLSISEITTLNSRKQVEKNGFLSH